MITEAVHFVGPDGSKLVMMTRELYEQLAARALDAEIPAAVRDALGRGLSPLAAWRGYRGLSQTALAKLSGVHRITILRLEASMAGSGSRDTRQRLASALAVPLAAI